MDTPLYCSHPRRGPATVGACATPDHSGVVIEAPWLVKGGHGASLRHHKDHLAVRAQHQPGRQRGGGLVVRHERLDGPAAHLLEQHRVINGSTIARDWNSPGVPLRLSTVLIMRAATAHRRRGAPEVHAAHGQPGGLSHYHLPCTTRDLYDALMMRRARLLLAPAPQ
jgi:hypothetical protein